MLQFQLLQFQLQLHIRRYCDSEAFLTAQFLFSFLASEVLAVSQDSLAARFIILTWKEEGGMDIRANLLLLEV